VLLPLCTTYFPFSAIDLDEIFLDQSEWQLQRVVRAFEIKKIAKSMDDKENK